MDKRADIFAMSLILLALWILNLVIKSHNILDFGYLIAVVVTLIRYICIKRLG